ncbi:MAG: hypothetical protein KatS3mg125_0740 [Lysobacterales bacterium]|nr:MAG: hypothetical protein KatS3mg125_0740 [Xanthomonadales bacterium]
MLVAAGLLRLGALVRCMPEPVVTGFTAGIAISIALSQVREALGLRMERLPGEFAERMVAYAEHPHTWDGATTALTLISILAIALLRRWRPGWPAFSARGGDREPCDGVVSAAGGDLRQPFRRAFEQPA